MKYCNWIIIIIILSGCVKPPQPPDVENQGPLRGKILVLNEGLFQQNNASITLINPETDEVVDNWFQLTYGRPLGDTGNDMIQYGDKIYIVVNVSGTIEVINTKTGDFEKQILLQDGTQNSKQPRTALPVDESVWVTNFDGTVSVIDTATLSITGEIQVGRNPEGLTRYQDRVFVANSGGLDYPNYDTTVSVIDVHTKAETRKVTIGPNASQVAADEYGNVYVLSRGDYNNIPPQLYIIDAGSYEAELFGKDSVHSVQVMNNQLYVSRDVNGNRKMEVYNTFSMQQTGSIDLPWDQFSTIGGAVIQNNGNIFCKDLSNYTNNGWVHEVNSNGVILKSWMTGLIPNTVLKVE